MNIDEANRRRLTIAAWTAAFAVLAIFIARHFDLATIWINIPLPDGTTARLANGLATVDSPFHTARSITLLDALRHGQLTRWYGQHQGGYPAEFYPTGAAWLDVSLWAVTLGQLPMEYIHRLLVALIVFAPALIFLWWAIREKLSPGVALLAGTGHAVIAGEWWSGGWTEVALWGLVTNVAAQTAIIGALLGVSGWLRQGRRRDLAIAGIFIAIAVGTNPRTFIALAAMGVASLIIAYLQPEMTAKLLAQRIVVLGVLSVCLSAPELFALLRYQHLYFFVHYSGYTDLHAWWNSSNTALWTPIFALALGGIVTSIALPGRAFVRTVGLTAVIYMGFTALLILWNGSIVQQLELTRLMPFQRMTLFFLAALFVYDVIGLIGKFLSAQAQANQLTGPVLAVLAFVLAWVVVVRPASWVRADEIGLQPLQTSATPEVADLKHAVQLADQSAPQGTSILILGSALSWHEPIDATNWSDRRFYYDDWLWYWQRLNYGDYDPNTEHAYPIDTSTLNPTYLSEHGIGAVIVTDYSDAAENLQNRQIAAQSPLLKAVATGQWYDVYLVASPNALVTSGSTSATQINITNESITASGTSDGSPIVIRQNWYPRWSATLNGQSVPITRRSDGYMEIAAPAGQYDLRIVYSVTKLDWFARALFVLGVIATLALLVQPKLFDWRPARFAPTPQDAVQTEPAAPQPAS